MERNRKKASLKKISLFAAAALILIAVVVLCITVFHELSRPLPDPLLAIAITFPNSDRSGAGETPLRPVFGAEDLPAARNKEAELVADEATNPVSQFSGNESQTAAANLLPNLPASVGAPERLAWKAKEMNERFAKLVEAYNYWLVNGELSPDFECDVNWDFMEEPERTLSMLFHTYHEIGRLNWGAVSEAVPRTKEFKACRVRIGQHLLQLLLESDPPDWTEAARVSRYYNQGWDTELYCLRQCGWEGRKQIVFRCGENLIFNMDDYLAEILFPDDD